MTCWVRNYGPHDQTIILCKQTSRLCKPSNNWSTHSPMYARHFNRNRLQILVRVSFRHTELEITGHVTKRGSYVNKQSAYVNNEIIEVRSVSYPGLLNSSYFCWAIHELVYWTKIPGNSPKTWSPNPNCSWTSDRHV